MAFPDKFKHELVLCFCYRRVKGQWRTTTPEPGVLRIGNRDCRQEFREPVLIGDLSHGFVEVRIHDDAGIDVANEATMLGEWAAAGDRCQKFLNSQIANVSGTEHVASL